MRDFVASRVLATWSWNERCYKFISLQQSLEGIDTSTCWFFKEVLQLWSRESFGFGWMFFEESFGSVLVFKGLAEVLLCRDFLTLMLTGGPCIYKLLKACLWMILGMFCVLILATLLPWPNLRILLPILWAIFNSYLFYKDALAFFPVLGSIWIP